MLFQSNSTKLCKTCKVPIEPTDTRCPEHETQYQQWLIDGGHADRVDVYVPRRNGIGQFGTRKCNLAPRRRGFKPGEELNFDKD